MQSVCFQPLTCSTRVCGAPSVWVRHSAAGHRMPQVLREMVCRDTGEPREAAVQRSNRFSLGQGQKSLRSCQDLNLKAE